MNRSLVNSARRDILDLCGAARHPQDFIHEAGRLLSRAVSCDGWIMHAVDPLTLLPSYGVSKYSRFPEIDCWQLARREYLNHDINDFSELAHSADHVAALGLTTGGVPDASVRFHEILRPFGLKDELRATFVADSACWGAATLVRSGHLPFSAHEVRFVADLSPHIGRALRELAWLGNLPKVPRFSPCVLILDDRDRVDEATTDAMAWLQQLKIVGEESERPVPLVVQIVAHYARASGPNDHVAGGFPRMRTSSGSWVSLRGARLLGKPRRNSFVAVIIEPASADAVAEFLLTSYRLSARERQIARLLALGRSSKEIAHTLEMSTHTVRDHVKKVLEKVAVHTRAELIAKLFVDPNPLDEQG